MKKFLISILVLIVFAGAFTSCKKETNNIYYKGGTPPVFSIVNHYSQNDTLILSQKDSALPCLDLLWTNPNYMFSTGVSSQNVTYILEIDSSGANFSSNKKDAFSVSNNVSAAITVKDLNTYVSNLNLQDTSIAQKLDVRIVATLVNSSVPLISNVINLWVKTYALPQPELYITGDATPAGWTNTPPDDQKFTYDKSTGTFSLTTAFVPGKAYKFLTVFGQWQPQWGGCGPAGGALSVNPGGGSDPAQINTPNDAGTYKITVDLNAKTCKVEKQ